MPTVNARLDALAADVLGPGRLPRIRSLCGPQSVDLGELARFDRSIGGPSLGRVDGLRSFASGGRYDRADRDVFRPLQYCRVYFQLGPTVLWTTRSIVWMSGLHIETLVKRIAHVGRLPLGAALGKPIVRRTIGEGCWEKAVRFASVHNEAKHELGHEAGTHKFTVVDAVFAYLIARTLGMEMSPHAGLSTNLDMFVLDPP